MPKASKKAPRKTTKISRAVGPMALAAAPKRAVIAIKVHFVLNTRNGLRRVIFGLEKDTEGDVTKWIINFQLFERANKTDDFGDAIITLDVEVDTELNQKAETAAHEGLTTGQAGHALGPAADDAKAAANGEIGEDEASATVQDTLRKK
jgi:hypothetical protein